MADDTRDYRALFLARTPLLDVRAPVEFTKGAFPGATNLPLLDDRERHRVGIRYKQAGQQAAIDLGNELVSGRVKRDRLKAWRQWHAAHPNGYLYCFRGGLRSHTTQAWLATEGVTVPLVVGGYKAMRRFLLESLDANLQRLPLWVLGGRTGCAKTRVIGRLGNALDLEGLAHHRGSAFGRRPGGQPSQIDFENRLAIDLLGLAERGVPRVVVEDESKLIGRCFLPLALQARLKTAPRVLIEEPLEARVQVTLEDYVIGPLDEYRRHYGPAHGFERLAEELLAAMDRIQSRLGGDRHRQLRGQLARALERQRRHGDNDAHRDWIRELLAGYYDPMYDYMMSKHRDGEILFRGTREEVLAFLR
ncbi:tRNA 2-selenouridine(34) synthase MnmH [Alloalcanivorax marinus]|uniref:tRNA 2-selenouridine(34) synthase MnmH n=1 Tax=Alloalcanivorax marinus TaxID=1177169 RepID=UPI001934366D|nr:tRNA 2-selenouridine(34) synthase MnmH [Alloalcanivorax marinus]MBL7251309.1 tRNA 2-selenouridine(34) synthase MnmH [Alloalcanivorax marinus]